MQTLQQHDHLEPSVNKFKKSVLLHSQSHLLVTEIVQSAFATVF